MSSGGVGGKLLPGQSWGIACFPVGPKSHNSRSLCACSTMAALQLLRAPFTATAAIEIYLPEVPRTAQHIVFIFYVFFSFVCLPSSSLN